MAIALGIATTRCSLTTSLDGLAGAEVADAGDAAFDAPIIEGGPSPDSSVEGGADGSVDGGDGGARFCASLVPAPMFCDDFDVEDSFARWGGMRLNAGGSVAYDQGASRSAPNSLLTIAPPNASAHGVGALQLSSASAVHRVRYAFDMRIDARDPQSAYAEASYIRFGGATGLYAFYMRLYGDLSSGTTFTTEAYLPDGGIPAHDMNVAAATFVDWMRVVVDLDLRTAPHVSITIDGALVRDMPLEPSLYPPALATVETGIGYGGTPSSGPWKLRYDNVTVDFEP